MQDSCLRDRGLFFFSQMGVIAVKQADLDRAVARATGETVSTIKRLGFLLADPADPLDPDAEELGPYVIDWDELESERNEHRLRGPIHEPAAA